MQSVDQQKQTYRHHITRPDWLTTPTQEPRGYIQSKILKELWFHMGTACNLRCPFCLEGSKPGDSRLNKMTLDDVRPFIDEALTLGAEKFSFTGGEPFVVKDIIRILDHALNYRPCLVLTNATIPLKKRLDELKFLNGSPNSLSFRVSIDYPDEQRHDAGRGNGNFVLSWEIMKKLWDRGFSVSIARRKIKNENVEEAEKAYHKYFEKAGLPLDTRIISFPDFYVPEAIVQTPYVTEHCMTQYHDEENRDQFMCSFSKMIVKKDGQMRVYACTLVDDDCDYDLGGSLKEFMDVRIMLKHHRCYSCFAQGASCSEL